MTAQTLHPAELSLVDIAAWRALCAAEPAYANPLMGPDFALAVGEVRGDTRVTVWRRDGRAVAFLAHHRRPGGLARPVGAPLSDYHGVVAEAGFDGLAAMAEAGLSAYPFTGLIDPAGPLSGAVAGEREAYVIELDGEPAEYLEALRAASPKRFKNYRRLDHKLDREVGELSVRAPDWDEAAFEQLLTWKREQLIRTGAHDFLGPDWTRDLLRNLFARREGEFQGLMINLYAGDRLVAGHFGIRLGGVYHPWIASTDPALAAWSPGQVFLLRAIDAMGPLGLTSYDIGPGHDHYKKPYARTVRRIGQGLAATDSAFGLAAKVAESTWMWAGAGREGFVDKVKRRLDTIAMVETSLAGRVRGLAAAAGALRKSDPESEAA